MSWIDFKRIKEEARFEPILERYGLTLEPKQGRRELVGLCPFHTDSKPSFSVNLEKRVFNCFGCKAGGGVIEFVQRQENVTVKEAAELVADWLNIEDAVGERRGGKRTERKNTNAVETHTSHRAVPKRDEPPAKATVPEEHVGTEAEQGELKPLTFALKLEPDHPYLAERKVSREVAEHFGIGLSSRGMMKGRICVPIHDAAGQLVAYVGRWPGDPPDGEPRYKLPPNFPKSKVLYNAHRHLGAKNVTVVEGVWSVFRLHELGVPAVALLGSSISPEQVEILIGMGVKGARILLDGDEAGRKAANDVALALAPHLFVRIVELPTGTQPDTVEPAELLKLLHLPDRQAGLPA